MNAYEATKAQKLALEKLQKKKRVREWWLEGDRIHVDLIDEIEPQVAIAPNGLVEPR